MMMAGERVKMSLALISRNIQIIPQTPGSRTYSIRIILPGKRGMAL